MQLPEEDEEYLGEKGFDWELIPVENEGCLILKNYPVSSCIYDRASTDVMIRIPAPPFRLLPFLFARAQAGQQDHRHAVVPNRVKRCRIPNSEAV